MIERYPAIYILTNKRNGTLYTGVTSNLIQRVHQHKFANLPGFTKKYFCNKLVYYELHEEMFSAIEREKQIKAGTTRSPSELVRFITAKEF